MPVKTTEDYLREILSGTSDQSQFGPQRRPGADTRTMEELKAAQGLSLLDAALGRGVPNYEMRLNPRTGRMEKQYKFPSGNVDVPPPPQENAPGIPDLLNAPPRYNMMGQREGFERPPAPAPKMSGLTPSIGEMPGPQTPPMQDKWDQIGAMAPELEKNERNRMILSIMEGLTRAGAEASNVPLLTELLAGKGRGPTDQRTADMLQSFIQKGKAGDEAKLAQAREYDNPMVKAARDDTGIDFKTIADVQNYYAMKKGKAGVEATEFDTSMKKEALDIQKNTAKQRAEMLRQGDLRGLNDKQQSKLQERREKLLKEEDLLINSVRNADKGINSVDLNDMAFIAAGVLVARSSGEVGNLSKTEQEIYRKNPGLKGDAQAMFDWVRSEIDQGRKDNVIEILQLHRDEGIKRLQKRVEDEAEAFRTFAKEADPAAVKKFIGLGMPAEVQGEKKADMEWYFVAKDTPDGKYKVGQKVQLTPEEAEQARAAGFIE